MTSTTNLSTNRSTNLATFLGAQIPTPRATAHLDTSMCTCGQDLDVYRSKHCPRCGVTLHHAHPLTRAA